MENLLKKALRGKGIAALLILSLMWGASCATAPYTQRSQLMLISRQQEISLGEQAAREIKSQARFSRDPAYERAVTEVGMRIARAAENSEYELGYSAGYDWEFFVIQDDTANAFALPGGKIYFHTGMFEYVESEGQLAAVMAHEAAHVLARHGAERLSSQLLLQVGAEAMMAALNMENPQVAQSVYQAYGVIAGIGYALPHSREQEYEADYIGMILMAKAGYDPAEAADFWQVMMRKEKTGQPPEFLSTHPAHENRLQRIRENIPMARAYMSANEPRHEQLRDPAKNMFR